MAESSELPKITPPGIGPAKRPSAEKVQVYQAKLSAAATMADLTPDYVFYTPALIYICNPLTFDPMADFLTENNYDIVPFSLAFNQPLFKGMETERDSMWNHVIYGVDKEQWPKLEKFLGSIAFSERDTGKLTRVRTQKVTIADPIFLNKDTVLQGNIPTVEITAFCMDTNMGSVYLKPGKHLVLDQPEVVHDKRSFKDTQALAKALFAGHADPYSAAENSVRKESTHEDDLSVPTG